MTIPFSIQRLYPLASLCGLAPVLAEQHQQITGRQDDGHDHHRRADLQELDECDRVTSSACDTGQYDVSGSTDDGTVAAEASSDGNRPPKRPYVDTF